MASSWRYIARDVGVGVLATAASLQAALPGLTGNDLAQAGLAGLIASLSFAGVGAAVRSA